MTKTVKVRDKTHERLNQQRIAGSTFDDVISNLLDLCLALSEENKIDNGGEIL